MLIRRLFRYTTERNRAMDEKTIFLAALEIAEPSQRCAFLDDACRDLPDLRRGVERLLSALPKGGDFLEAPPLVLGGEIGPTTTDEPSAVKLDFLAPSTRQDALGRLGHYEILEVVGSGGFGVVLKAFDAKLHRIVAIKTLAVAFAASASARRRFVREAQAAAAVNHDNVVDIYAVEESGPVPYLVMEYIGGISLEERLQQNGPLELKETLRIALQTADGLAAAHRQGLVHRDVKPANILLENGVMRVKITDFGLARAVDDTSLSQAGIIAGTPTYMSPEQAHCAVVDCRSDLFSLGSVLYAMCAGQSPFKASTSLGAIKRVCEDTPRPLREVIHDIPAWLCAIVEKLLSKAPADRYQSAAEVVELLTRGLAHVQQPALALPPELQLVASPTLQRQRRPATLSAVRSAVQHRWWVAAAVLIFLTAGLVVAEGTGVSHFTATIVRILTPDGTLIVEVSEPGVSVTVDGNGDGVVITGAGIHELRLRPGQHQVQATKDGKPVPVDQPLVTIEQGGKQIVKVVREEPPLSRLDKLQQAEKRYADARRLCGIGEPLRAANPWDAEGPFREALSLYEQLVQEFPGVPKYEEGRNACRFMLGSTLGIQSHYIYLRNRNPSAEEATRAIAVAKEATELIPKDLGTWTHLGRAHYRAKEWKSALTALEKMPSDGGYNGCRYLFITAMTHWQLGNRDEARQGYDQAVQWMDAHKPDDPALRRDRAEAMEISGWP